MSITEADLKEKARTLVKEIVQEGNLDLIDEHFAEDYVGSSNAVPEPYDREGFKEFVTTLRTAFPDLEITFEDVIAEGDTVVRQDRDTATHKGELLGIEPTGKEVVIEAINVERFDEDGKVVEERTLIDMWGLMQQLGVVEPPGQ